MQTLIDRKTIVEQQAARENQSAGLIVRPRRLRATAALRSMVQETHLHIDSLIMPFFIVEGSKRKLTIDPMPGIFKMSVDTALFEIEKVAAAGILAILLFGIPDEKDDEATSAWLPDGVVQKAIREIKRRFPELIVIADTCLCEHMDHGHCGLVSSNKRNWIARDKHNLLSRDEHTPIVGDKHNLVSRDEHNLLSADKHIILNDPSVALLAKTARAQAEAGADMVAPSDMMDGTVAAIRNELDQAGFSDIPIMSYSAKFASAFYGPFRVAAQCAPQFGDRRSYQMNPANGREALREIELDVQQGADIIMVKPALSYLDIIFQAKQMTKLPLAAYNVSGEYAMVKAAAANGWIDEKRVVLEALTGIVRAGANLIITYHALDVAQWLNK